MENKKLFSDFSSVLETEILDDLQMNAIEAGGACQQSCKKSCQPGNQNYNIGNGNNMNINKGALETTNKSLEANSFIG